MLFVPNKNLLEDLPILAYCKDSDGIYSYCNNYMAQRLDFADAKEVIGKSDFELMLSDNAKKIRYTDLQVVMQNKIMIIVEQLQSTKLGAMNLLGIKAPLKSQNAATLGVIGIYVDLDNQQAVDFNANLMEELININTIMAMRQIKHDLRGPIGAIGGFAELIFNSKNDAAKILSLSSFLINSCRAMDDFIDSLTKTCIPGINKAEKVFFNLHDLLQNVYDISSPMAYYNKLNLYYTSAIEKSFIVFNFKDKIFRILMELVNNAVKYTKDGIVEIKSYFASKTLKTANGTESIAHDAICIDIFNSTGAMMQGDIDRILSNNAFFEDEALICGKGFGLSMIGSLVKFIDGKIEVNSSPETGTTITLIITNDKSC